MSRPLRIEYENAWYHVTNRGAARQKIFLTQKHREMFLEVVLEVYRRFRVEVHAYCLMPNHYHLLIKTPLANLSTAMRHLKRRFNISCKRDGPLFRGRFKSIVVDSENYLLRLSRYIHLNPVVAGLVKKPEAFSWSSYQYFIKANKSPEWLRCDATLERFSQRLRRKQYQLFVQEGIDKEIDTFYQKAQRIPILGTEAFTKTISEKYLKDKAVDVEITEHKNLIKKQLPTIEDVFVSVAEYYQVEISELKRVLYKQKNMPRQIAIYLSIVVAQATLNEIANFLGNVSYSAVAKAFARFSEGLQSNKLVAEEVEKLRDILLR